MSHRPAAQKNQRNIRLRLSYDGKAFFGYQYQPHVVSVQETINKAWKILAHEDVTLYACSRLDKDVSADDFHLNFFSNTPLELERVLRGLNGIFHHHLKVPILIRSAHEEKIDFNARFDNYGKHYRYLLWHGFSEHIAITKKCWKIKGHINFDDITYIAKLFVGEKDFAAYRAQDCSARSTIKTIRALKTTYFPEFPELCALDFYGDGFLKNMIRNIVGTIVSYSKKQISEDEIAQSFDHGERKLMGECAPGFALTLKKVYYDNDDYLNDINQPSVHSVLL